MDDIEIESKSTVNSNASLKRLIKCLRSLAKQKTLNRMYRFSKRNQIHALVGGVMLIGVLLTLFSVYYSGMIAGMIGGYFLCSHLLGLCYSFPDFLENNTGYEAFILVLFTVTLIFSASSFIVGTIIGMFIQRLVENSMNQESDEQE